MNLTAVIKPIRYVTAKIGTGGGAGRGDHEVVTAEIAPDDNVLPHYIDTLVGKYYKSDELPIVFTTTGTALTDWKIYGNEDGLGDYTGADLYSGTLEQGRIYDDSGALDSSDTRIRTDGYFAALQAGTYRFNVTKSASAASAAMRACVYAYDGSGNYIGYFPSDWAEFPFQVSLPAANYKMMISYTNNSNILPAHVSSVTCVPAGADVPTITDGYSIPVTVRGKNLFDKSNYQIVRLYPKGDGGANGRATSASVSWSIVMPCRPNTDYVFSMYSPTGTSYRNRMNIGGYAVYPVNGTAATIFDNTNARDGDYMYNSFATDADTRYLLIFLWSDSSYTEQVVAEIIQNEQLQLEEGTERTAYEAYHHNTVSLLVNHPLDAGDSISRTSTGVNIPVSNTLTNVLSVDTAVQPDEVYLNFP